MTEDEKIIMAEIKELGKSINSMTTSVASQTVQVKIMWSILASVGGSGLVLFVFLAQRIFDVVFK